MVPGDLVQWQWRLAADSWMHTQFTGIVLGSRMAKTDREKIRLYSVFASDGTVVELRGDENGLGVIRAP